MKLDYFEYTKNEYEVIIEYLVEYGENTNKILE